jgi:hypothetical protein
LEQAEQNLVEQECDQWPKWQGSNKMKLRGAKLEKKNYYRGAKISFFLFSRLKL